MEEYDKLRSKKFNLEGVEIEWEDLRAFASSLCERCKRLCYLIASKEDNPGWEDYVDGLKAEKEHLLQVQDSISVLLYGKKG